MIECARMLLCVLLLLLRFGSYADVGATSFVSDGTSNGVVRGGNCQKFWISNFNTSNSPQCNCTELTIRCINLQLRPQMTDADFFLQIETARFPYLKSVTVHGNNLERLPKRLFGPNVVHSRLTSLNLSANFFMYIHPEGLVGAPNLTSLDLSDNEIVLDDNSTLMFNPLPNLEEVYLNKAFSYGQLKAVQADNIARLFKEANLQRLQHLELKNNWLPVIPKLLGCYLPALRTLKFGLNPVGSWDVNASCFRRLETLDLTWLLAPTLNQTFINFVNQLPSNTRILMRNSHLHCTQSLRRFIEWLNMTSRITDKDQLVCVRASPSILEGRTLLSLNATELSGLGCCVNSAAFVRTSRSQGICNLLLFVLCCCSRLLLHY